jgi:hypothetical protein
MRTRHPTIGASSELETCAHVFWNVLERQLLVSASCDCVSDSEFSALDGTYGSEFWWK